MNKPVTLDEITATLAPDAVFIERRPDMFVPDEDLRAMDRIGEDMRDEEAAERSAGKVECGWQGCGEWFVPRSRSGGKPQRFCKPECKTNFHAEQKANVPNVAQRAAPLLATAAYPSRPDANNASAALPDEPFDWDGSRVLAEQMQTAVYFNKAGELVIRQEARWDQEDDSFIFIAADHIGDFIEQMFEKAGRPAPKRSRNG